MAVVAFTKKALPEEQDAFTDEERRIGISYSGFCLTGLPHKRLPDDQPWHKRGYKVTLLVEPGRLVVNGKPVLYGVPYGARARMILIFLMSEAVRTQSREILLGRNMADFLARMGISLGGETYKAIREQAARVSACSLKFFWDAEGGQATGWQRGSIVSSGLQFHASDDARRCVKGQGSLFEDRVVLDEAFWRALREHPVPMLEAAIRKLRDRSMSLDLYIWLAYRLHKLSGPTEIGWFSLHEQFGSGFKTVRQFKPEIRKALAAALDAYPEAKVSEGESGMILFPSPPPVSPKLIPIARQVS